MTLYEALRGFDDRAALRAIASAMQAPVVLPMLRSWLGRILPNGS